MESLGAGATRHRLRDCAFQRITAKSGCRTARPVKAAPRPPTEIVRINPEKLSTGGLDPSLESEANRGGFAEMLQKGFLPVNLNHPGLRIMNIDPPVLTVQNFLPDDVCDSLIEAAEASGRMAQSQIGGGSGAPDDMRTSTTLAITKSNLASCPQLEEPLSKLLAAAAGLVTTGMDGAQLKSNLFTPPSSPSQVTPELPQVAKYMPGQHFLAHEDGFPAAIALDKGYQRRGTLLVYLNDVAEGGATYFDHLGFGVQPEKGKALLFFPAFSGGMPDARTLHTAQDAVDVKYVSQLWLCSGLPVKKPAPAVAVAPGAARSGGGSKKSGSKKRSKR